MKNSFVDPEEYPPWAWLNVLITIGAGASALGALYFASHAQHWWQILIAVIVFSFVNNTLFSLLHEAVHFTFSRNRWINDGFGIVLAAFFPTGLLYQRVCHLGHHARNRTDDEMFDLYYPDDNKILKRIQLYCILTPMYWGSIVFGTTMYLFFPWFYDFTDYLAKRYRWVHRTGTKMLEPFMRHPKAVRMRVELLYTLAFQIAIFTTLQLSWQGWLMCYLAFGMNWCSVQYADHAWSDRDVVNGAWNLRVNKVVQYLFLNYHHHAAHHSHPNLPWIHLHKFVDFDGPRPSFLRIYLELWRGPKPTKAGEPKPVTEEFLNVLWNHSRADNLASSSKR